MFVGIVVYRERERECNYIEIPSSMYILRQDSGTEQQKKQCKVQNKTPNNMFRCCRKCSLFSGCMFGKYVKGTSQHVSRTHIVTIKCKFNVESMFVN